jgi:hypothetical protein
VNGSVGSKFTPVLLVSSPTGCSSVTVNPTVTICQQVTS